MKTSGLFCIPFWKALGIVVCVGLMTQPTALAAPAEHRLPTLFDLQREILSVRNGSDVDTRTVAAERLADLASKINPKTVDEKTLSEIIGLLDSDEDSMRGEVAGALGGSGSHAKPAVPKLLCLLPEADCLMVELSSGGAIRVALGRIGAKVPPRPRCPWEIASDHDPKVPFVMTPTVLRSSVDTFDGQIITVVGWMTLEPEDANLWTSEDDMVSLRRVHCVSLENIDPFRQQRRTLSGQRVEVTGTFRKDVVEDTRTLRFSACDKSAIELVSVRVLSNP